MIKTILVPAAGDESDTAVFAAAAAVARSFGAHLDVLHVRVDPANVALAMSTDGGSGALAAGLMDRLQQDEEKRTAAARQVFERNCAEAGIAIGPTSSGLSAEWHVEAGEEPRWIATYGLSADLIVAARDTANAAAERSLLEAALLDTGRPLLIPAAAPVAPSFARIAIAWKPAPQAARAIALAMPFLTRASAVSILTVAEADAAAEAHPASERLCRNLARHGVAADLTTLPPGADGAAATLLSAAAERADLLVMGGYGHSRLQEWVFGGVTQQVLTAAPLPVLMAH